MYRYEIVSETSYTPVDGDFQTRPTRYEDPTIAHKWACHMLYQRQHDSMSFAYGKCLSKLFSYVLLPADRRSYVNLTIDGS
jgi:hypothetical protein